MQREQNILRVYHQAGAGEIDAGLRWYLTAHDEAERLSGTLRPYEGPDSVLTRAAGIIAAVSPGLRWERNIEAAERIIAREPLDGIGVRWYDGVRKAERILGGESVYTVLRGNKVRSFCDNIARPMASDKVCIDGHAYAVWSAERITLDSVPLIADSLYLRIESDYVKAAEIAGIRPLQLQAITWITWRRLHGVNSAHYLPLFER